MRKIIKRKIHISTHKRDFIDFINDEFYSHDKHNAFIEFTMKLLPTDNIIALFYFQKTKRYVETKAFVDGDKFTIEFDTSLINTDETVLGFIYFEKVAQSADVHRFSFGVKVSEIDKLHDIPIQEQTTKRVVAIEDIVTKTELDELFKRIEKNGGTYNDTEIRNSISSISERVQTLENKPDNDTRYDDSDVKSRLSALESNSSRYLTEHQPLTSVEERIQQVEARFNNLSNIYLSSHQSLEHLATKVALSAVEQRVEQLEQNRSIDSSIENRLTALENKPTVDITEFAKKSEIPQPYNDSALMERVSLLESKAITNGAYDDKPLLDKIHAIEEQFRNASNLYLQSHQSLEHLVTKKELEDKHYLTSVPEEYAKKTDLYNDSDLRNKITQLETNSVTKEKVESVENRVQVLENKSVVTHEELEQAGYAKTTDFTNLATNSKVEAVESRVLALENKPTVVPYDDKKLINRMYNFEQNAMVNDAEVKRRLITLESKTDNFISGVSVNKEGNNVTLTYNYVDGQTKNVSFTDSDTVNIAYDDSGLKQRITNLENRPQVESYNDADIKQRLAVLEAKPTVDVSEYAKKTEVPTIDSVNNLLRTQGEQATKLSALEAKSAYEIHGTGMPNGRVTAPIGTTYVDTAVTNGALKWIKESGDGNTGWKVLIGDTGWRTLNIVSKLNTASLQIRRVNNAVTYNFGGLSWGWFGIVRRNGQGYVGQGTDFERNCFILTEHSVPVGFRTPNSLIGPIYNDRGVAYGTWYIGNPSDNNHLRFQFLNPIPTDQDIGDIRVSTISYYTDDEWPTTLP